MIDTSDLSCLTCIRISNFAGALCILLPFFCWLRLYCSSHSLLHSFLFCQQHVLLFFPSLFAMLIERHLNGAGYSSLVPHDVLLALLRHRNSSLFGHANLRHAPGLPGPPGEVWQCAISITCFSGSWNHLPPRLNQSTCFVTSFLHSFVSTS